MPCYDGRESERTVFVDRDNPEHLKHIAELTQSNKWYEASLCALITELERKGIANEIMSQASKSGLINLMDFWKEHSKEDETRLAYELHKFSEQEQVILKKLLNN